MVYLSMMFPTFCNINVNFFNSDIFNELKESKRFLDLEDNWDDLGSKSYKLETWNKMKNFLLKSANFLASGPS